MKKITYIIFFLFLTIKAFAQDEPPSGATVVSPNFTWYRKISPSDTLIYGYSNNKWINFARRSWVKKNLDSIVAVKANLYTSNIFSGSNAFTGSFFVNTPGPISIKTNNYTQFYVNNILKMQIADGNNSDSYLNGIWYIPKMPTHPNNVVNKRYVDSISTVIGDGRYGQLIKTNNWTNHNYSTGGWYGQNFVSTSYGGTLVPGDASFGFSVISASQFNNVLKGFYIKTNGITDWFAGEAPGGDYVLSKWNVNNSSFSDIFTVKASGVTFNSGDVIIPNNQLRFRGVNSSETSFQQGNAELLVNTGATTFQVFKGNRIKYRDPMGTDFPYALLSEVAAIGDVYNKTQSDANYVNVNTAQTVGGTKTWSGAQIINRAVADASTVFTVNNQGGTGSLQSWQFAGAEIARLQTNGYLYARGVIDLGGSSNGFFGVGTATAGNSITRNVADGAATLTVNNVNNSSTGALVTAQVNGVNRFIVLGNGDVNLTTLYASGRVGIGTSNVGALIHINPSTFLTSGSFGINGFGINQNAVTYTANGTSGTVAAAYINSYATPTLSTPTTSILTKAYNSYFVAPIAGTNVSIGTSYGIGTNGNIETSTSIPATSGTMVQNSPFIALQGNVWNTSGTPASNTALWQMGVFPASGATPTSVFNINSTMQGGPTTTVFQLTSAGNINATGQIGVSRPGIAITPTIGFNAFNNTSSSSITPVQMSPNYTMLGTAWNTTSGTSELKFLTMDLLPVSGGSTSSNWRLGFSSGGAYNYPFSISNTGDVTTSAISNSTGSNNLILSRNATSGRFETFSGAPGQLLSVSAAGNAEYKTVTAGNNTNIIISTGGVNVSNTIRTFRLTASGTGSATTISIPHGQSGITPASTCIVTPLNAASSGSYYITKDATNVNIIYTIAPVSGTSNLSYDVYLNP